MSISPSTGAAIARYVGTAAITALVAIQPSYPNAHWITPVILVLGILGFHAVPTAVQVAQKLLPKPQALSIPTVSVPKPVGGGGGGSVTVVSGTGSTPGSNT